MTTEQLEIGFIGLGAMGQGMALNLITAGYLLHVFDLVAEKITPCKQVGAQAASSAGDVVKRSEVIFTSLTDSAVSVNVIEHNLLPHARSGQVFIVTGTVMPHEIKRLAALFADKGAALLDVPVSGGQSGAQAGMLRMFAGGAKPDFERVLPLLNVIGDPDYIIYCGPSGSGQRVKLVNQMAAGLSTAACLESIALGVKSGIDPEILVRALGGNGGWRAYFRQICTRVAQGDSVQMGVKFGQLGYFMDAAEQVGLTLPLAQALHAFCEAGELLMMEANRASPSFWHELMYESQE